jgi:prepilin-type N-terminal cleavage/methylation domain-containing protein
MMDSWMNGKGSGIAEEKSAIQQSIFPKIHSSRGFSLLEVLVALVVFAIGVSGMLVALGHHMKDVSFSEDYARALRIATREMNALRRYKFIPEAEMTGEEGRYVWLTEVEEVDDELPGITSDEAGQSRAPKPCSMSVLVQWSDVEGGELKRRVELNGLELFQRR